MHYKGLRTACRDFKKNLKRDELDNIFNRATPHKWMKYANAKMALQILSLRDGGPPISLKIQQNIGVNDRTGNWLACCFRLAFG